MKKSHSDISFCLDTAIDVSMAKVGVEKSTRKIHAILKKKDIVR